KLFFKLACRGKGRPKYIKQSKRIRGDSEFVSAGSEVFIACATSPEYSMYDSSRATFSNILSSFISKYLGNKKGHLSDIDREIRMGLAKKEAPRSTTGLTKKVFFSPKIKRKPLDEQTEEKWWDALQNGGEKTVKHILAHYNVDVNTKDNDGETPLYYAARYNSIEVAEILIAKGTDVNAKNKKEWTPLNLAADADKSIRNNKNKTPLDLARKWHRKEMIGLLK
ncbi:MAG: ankyrin repeat domain-containing protein, partial [Chlamydiota bacterium]